MLKMKKDEDALHDFYFSSTDKTEVVFLFQVIYNDRVFHALDRNDHNESRIVN